MSRHHKRVIGLHEDAVLARTIAALWPDVDERQQRAAQIATLPAVEWKGRTLFTIRCHGDFGRGPHNLNVPESLLWSLMNLNWFLCPYHR